MQSRLRLRVGFWAITVGALAAACSSDKSSGSSPEAGVAPESDGGTGGHGGSGGGGGSGGAGGSSTVVDAGACDVTVAPSDDDLTTIQGALDGKVKTGNTVCFSPGTYKLKNHITLASAAKVTFVGTGSKRDDVVLDFTGQTNGDEGVLVTTEGFTIENLSIKNTQGNGIKVQADNSVFRNIKVGWDVSGTADGGPTSGGYAIYPTGCDHTVMENNEVYGAADAGIYAGQCKHVIARNNDSHDNVLGIEIENTLDSEVYGNEVHGNTTGFLLDLLPDLQQKTTHNYYVHDNHVYDNNRVNFAEANTLAATAPQGTGVLVLASRDIEVTRNKIEGNGGVGIIIVSYDIIDLLAVLNGGKASTPDPTTSRWPQRVYVHDNTFGNNGFDPQGSYAVFAVGTDAGKKVVPYDVLWDGILDPHGYGDGDAGAADAGPTTAAQAHICLGATEQKSFVDFHGDTALTDPTMWTTDTTPHQCTLPALPSLTP
jgi:parallel beta-helix repeat protein